MLDITLKSKYRRIELRVLSFSCHGPSSVVDKNIPTADEPLAAVMRADCHSQ